MSDCKHAYEVRAQAAYCPKCLEWAHLAAALRYTNKRLASTEAENKEARALMLEGVAAWGMYRDCASEDASDYECLLDAMVAMGQWLDTKGESG